MLEKYQNSLKNSFSGKKKPVLQAEKRVWGDEFWGFWPVFKDKNDCMPRITCVSSSHFLLFIFCVNPHIPA
jgi:hypothetical protein